MIAKRNRPPLKNSSYINHTFQDFSCLRRRRQPRQTIINTPLKTSRALLLPFHRQVYKGQSGGNKACTEYNWACSDQLVQLKKLCMHQLIRPWPAKMKPEIYNLSSDQKSVIWQQCSTLPIALFTIWQDIS